MHRRLDGHAGSRPGTPRRRGLTTLVATTAMIVALLALALPSAAEDLTSSVDGDAATTSTTADAADATTDASPRPPTRRSRRRRSSATDRRPRPPPPRRRPPRSGLDATVAAAAAPAAPTSAAALAVPAAASIAVTPATGLVQGDVVTITGSGFPAITQLAFVQCIPGSGPEACNLNNLVYVTSNPSGGFTTTFTPSRILRIAGVNHDCAVAGECRIGGGTLPDGSVAAATAEIQFDPSVPPPPPPTLTVTPSTNLLDRQTVAVVGTNYDAGSLHRRRRVPRRSDDPGQRRLRLRDPAVRGSRQLRVVHGRRHRPSGSPRRRHAGRLRRARVLRHDRRRERPRRPRRGSHHLRREHPAAATPEPGGHPVHRSPRRPVRPRDRHPLRPEPADRPHPVRDRDRHRPGLQLQHHRVRRR